MTADADAIKWYRKAAKNGDVNGLSNLKRLEGRIDLDKYLNIFSAYSDLMAAQVPLIGDCSLLPHSKKSILYAIIWVRNHFENIIKETRNESLREKCDGIINTANYLLTRLATDWHEIDPEDKNAVANLTKFDSFPDWALPLKAKYINEEKASTDAAEAAFQVTQDKVRREKTHGKSEA